MPSNITLEDVNKEKDFANVESVVDVAYDEAGSRLWYSVDNRVRNEKWTEVTLAGIGVFKSENADAASPTYNLVRQDLVAGAYRDASGSARFPVLDAQGSVRGYVTSAGLESAYDYYPYGTVVDVSPNGGDDNRRWQDKEFDNEHHKYYFGSRYFDPFFGMWMSPDPAGQFANPYSYGGDPLNYIDPTGMWALGLGLVVGYDSNHGWSFGFGTAAEIGDYGFNTSFSFNQDGSKSLNSGVNLKVPIQTPWVYLEINMGLGFTLNSYSGTSISGHGGVCVGEAGSCVGVDLGGSLYWDRSGGFAGMTVYAELYVQFAGGLARVSGGYEAGLFGAEGRGAYIGATVAGIHGEVSDRDGESWGLEEALYYKLRNDGTDPDTKKPRKYVGLNIPSLGIFSDVVMYDHGNRNDNQKEVMGRNRDRFIDLAKENGLAVGHYSAATSVLHENLGFWGTLGYYFRLLGSLVNLVDPPKRTVDKMWMGRNSVFSPLYGWLLIPSVEGLFYPGGEYIKGASYNYGNNFISHIFLDVVPGWILGYEP